MTESPFLSVVITAYNRTEFLPFAVRSVLSQRLDKDLFEIIIVKNFRSEIDELLIANNIALQESCSLFGRQLSTVLEHCRGKIICFLDDDDLMEPNRLAEICKAFSEDTLLGYYHNNSTSINGAGNIIRDPQHPDWTQTELKFYVENIGIKTIPKLRRLGANFNNSCIAIRKDILQQKVRWLRQLKSAFDDFAFFAALCAGLPLVIDSAKLTRYRISSSSLARADLTRKLTYYNRWVDDCNLIFRMTREDAPTLVSRYATYFLTTVKSRRDCLLAKREPMMTAQNVFKLLCSMIWLDREWILTLILNILHLVSPAMARRRV